MAVTTKPPDNHNHLLLPSLISIDMSSFTHSELHSLSLLSSSNDAGSSSSTTAAQFSINPSLSTHQQTYSLSPHPHRHRTFSLLNQERSESNLIVSFLRKHLQFDDFTSPERPPKKRKENFENVTVEIVNRNGVVVNLAALEEREIEGGPFAEELRKKAEGRVKEEELLEILAAMEGDWCSRRKKRRVVDASLLGDALPVGWKLIIALRRKGGHFTPYCRRYISPTGEQFLSCKEVSSYLKSYFGIDDAKLVGDSMVEYQQPREVDSINDSNSMLDMSNSTIHNACVSTEHEEKASILGIDNLPDVQICDLYECHACNISFDMKDKYLQHVLSLHQRTTKRYTLEPSVDDKVIIKDGKPECRKRRKKRKIGSSVGDGVIIKDGKYGCQFCHKVFEERRRYLGHVGNHVKGSIKTSKGAHVQAIDCAKSPCLDRLPTMVNNSRMDALIEIAQSSIQDINIPEFEKEPASVNNVDPLCVDENLQTVDVNLKTGKNSSSCFNEADKGKHCWEGKTFSVDIYPCEMVSGISSVCPNEAVSEKDIGKGKFSSEELHLPCDKVTEMSMTDTDIGHLDFSEHEGEDIGEDENLSLQLNYTQVKMVEMQRSYGNFNDPTSCSNEGELEKDSRNDESLPTELNSLAEMSKVFLGNGVIKGEIVDSEKNSCSEMTITPAAENDIAEKISVYGRRKSTTAEGKGSADEPGRFFNIHYIRCNGKASSLESSGEKLDHVQKFMPAHAQQNDGSELATVSGKNHASGCAVPQILLNSSSPFDEIEKAGQNICSLDQNLESVTGLEYMKLDAIEPQMYEYSSMSQEDSISFYEVSMDLGNNIGLGLGLDNSLKSRSEFPQEMGGRCVSTTVCVWCGVEFSHEISDVEPQADSVGFMCPACRAKISKQFNDLESNFSDFPLF